MMYIRTKSIAQQTTPHLTYIHKEKSEKDNVVIYHYHTLSVKPIMKSSLMIILKQEQDQ